MLNLLIKSMTLHLTIKILVIRHLLTTKLKVPKLNADLTLDSSVIAIMKLLPDRLGWWGNPPGLALLIVVMRSAINLEAAIKPQKAIIHKLQETTTIKSNQSEKGSCSNLKYHIPVSKVMIQLGKLTMTQ